MTPPSTEDISDNASICGSSLSLASETISTPAAEASSVLSRARSIFKMRKRKKSGDAHSFDGILLILGSIKESADVFPPLKSTASTLITAINMCRDFRENRTEWIEFAQELTRFIVDLNEILTTSLSTTVKRRVESYVR
ncbi:hypothetical protein SISNIDRAFT_491588 [Sistotremastrum niveocremeum HHB9708]|uniref:Uncharacterized protein n=1 Tax=Sistotremastrum niveocremeum HHB9708 TaxID=1314777 RepID=A0A164MMI9_9AGAM|nr:hypothetical protein SISNIDRAFT_491588 [Sistotremastrum niveocremeum HHB9708]